MARTPLSDGTLLDTLVVKITVDMSGLRKGITEAIAEIRTFKGAVAGGVGGVSLGDVMTTALVAPIVVASARLGQLRTQMRLLSAEIRTMALLTAGGPSGGGRNAGSLVPYVAGGLVLDATRGNQARDPASGRYRRGASYESRDLAEAAGRNVLNDDEVFARRMDGAHPDAAAVAAGAAAGGDGRRRRGWFARTFSGSRAQRAFRVGRREFPGFEEAADNLGHSAHGVGAAGRRAAGGGIARALGLVGLGTLFSEIISLGTSLATVIGGTLAGAFAAMATPIGLVVTALTALAALFVAANWENFKKFGEWVETRFNAVVGPSWAHLMRSLGEAWAALVQLWRTLWNDNNGLKSALQDLWVVAEPIFKLLAEIVVRVAATVIEALAGIVRIFTEIVGAIEALVRGDWSDLWNHLQRIVAEALGGIGRMFMALLPEVAGPLARIGAAVWHWLVEKLGEAVDWCAEKLQWLGDEFKRLWDRVVGHSYVPDMVDGIAAHFARLDSVMVEPVVEACGQASDAFADLFAETAQAAPSATLERLGSLADDFGSRISKAFEDAIVQGRGFGDIIKALIADLAMMVVRMAVIEPLARSISDALRGVFGGGGGSSGGSVASTFAGFFADGGEIRPGQWGVVGERGAELVFGGRTGATVVPAAKGGALGGIDARAYIDARGADQAAIARLQQALARRDAELPSQIRAQIGNMRQRGRI